MVKFLASKTLKSNMKPKFYFFIWWKKKNQKTKTNS